MFSHWQAPDRDSPKAPTFEAGVAFPTTVDFPEQLDALLQMEGRAGTIDAEVEETTGKGIKRVRRWHKIYERMGLLYQDDHDKTRITDLGSLVAKANAWAPREFRRSLARPALKVLARFQLDNPADLDGQEGYPEGTDIHPYWSIWKAIVELDGKLHWDELNRELMHVLRHDDLEGTIARIRNARIQPGYDPVKGGTPAAPLRDRSFDQKDAPEGKDPDGQIRDQKATPWFRRAGFGGLLLLSPQEAKAPAGYWSIADDVRDLVQAAVKLGPPPYSKFSAKGDWFKYLGTLDDKDPTLASPMLAGAPLDASTDEVRSVLLKRKNVVLYGPPGTGKTHSAFAIADAWTTEYGADCVFHVTFHPAFGYEDFVQGFRPVKDTPGQFELRPGPLPLAARAAESASQRGASVLMVIDEINRGDVARIFGELITYIEADKRGRPCRLAQTPDVEFVVPDNLFFLGTMNSADKSVSLLDVALRRRFAFIEYRSDPTAFTRVAKWTDTVDGVDLGALLGAINRRLLQSGVEPDRAIGHALLSIPSGQSDPLKALGDRLRFDVIPLVQEYCYLDRSRMRKVLGALVDEAGRPGWATDLSLRSALNAFLAASKETVGE